MEGEFTNEKRTVIYTKYHEGTCASGLSHQNLFHG